MIQGGLSKRSINFCFFACKRQYKHVFFFAETENEQKRLQTAFVFASNFELFSESASKGFKKKRRQDANPCSGLSKEVIL